LDKTFELLPLVVPFVAYPPVAASVLRLSGRLRWFLFALVNIVFTNVAIIATFSVGQLFQPGLVRSYAAIEAPLFFLYASFVLVQYALMRSPRTGAIAYLFPIGFLILVKYVPGVDSPLEGRLMVLGGIHLWAFMLGVSYVAFRLTHLVSEVRNEVVAMPSLWEYLAYAFYVPVLFVGPITPYSLFRKSLDVPQRPVLRSFTRIVVGLVKYVFLSATLSLLTYAGLLQDGHPHSPIDLVVAILVYPAFLYFNFSGLCDLAIGVSGLLGIEVVENFDRPFAARNFQEFWSRWHISLSAFMRDMMFTPMVKALTRRFGAKRIDHIIAFAIVSVFLVIGVWHGAGWNFVLFGLSQGLGVMTIHYTTLTMRRRLGKEGFARYRANPTYRVAGMIGTYLYFALTMILFANTLDKMHTIVTALR